MIITYDIGGDYNDNNDHNQHHDDHDDVRNVSWRTDIAMDQPNRLMIMMILMAITMTMMTMMMLVMFHDRRALAQST